MIERTLFSPEHDAFRATVRAFIAAELTPGHAQWEEDGQVPRAVWQKAGAVGMLCCATAETYGGAGADFLFNVVVIEELARAGISGPGFAQHSDMVATYIERFASEELKHRWLPAMVSGEKIGAIAISEPAAGSDVRGIQTAMRRDGNHYVLRGQKTYISNGQLCDFALVVAKLDPTGPRSPVSIVLVESDRPGFVKGRRLRKLGLKAQDTSELFFDDVRVPASNLVGKEHEGLTYLTRNLAHERLVQAIRGIVVSEVTIEQTVDYTVQRKAFEATIADFQNTQFKLAELRAATLAGRVFVDRCIALQMEGRLAPVDAAAAKLMITELQCRVTDECLQLHGGAGYMWESPVCRAFADARVMKIGGGAVEVMKQIIARDMFKGKGPKAPA